VKSQRGHFVSRGGHKLTAALDAFTVDVAGFVCADFGANVGGFTDCLLQRGAAKVYAVETGYGELAWTLRNDPRVVVMERTNALHCPPPQPVDLVVIDLGWTPQALAIPAARSWLKPHAPILSLLKPHYEWLKLSRPGGRRRRRRPLSDAQGAEICQTVCRQLADKGLPIAGLLLSPLRGKGGNVEYWLLLN